MKFSPKTRLTDRVFLWCVFLSLFISTIAGVCGQITTQRRLEEKYRSEAGGIALSVSATMDTADVAKWLSEGKQDDSYDAMRKRLQELYDNSAVDTVFALYSPNGSAAGGYAYVFRLNDTENTAENAWFGDTVMTGTFDESVLALFRSALQSTETGKTLYTESVRNGKSSFVAYLPLFDENGKALCLIGAEVPQTVMGQEALATSLISAGAALVLMTMLCVILLLILRRRVTQPVSRMTESAENYIEQLKNSEDPSKIDYSEIILETRDEVAQLSDSMNRMAQELQKATKDYSLLVDNKKSVTDEVSLANRIMRNLYPSVYPAFPGHTEFDVFAEFRTDYMGRYCFYDYFMTDKKHLCMIIGEASGSGVPSMIYTVLASANIRSFARLGYEPYRIAVETNNLLSVNNSEGITVSAIIAKVDLTDGTMVYVNAGEPNLLIKRAGSGFTDLKQKQNFVLAGMENVTFTQNRIELMQGDMVLMFTSTVPETLNPAGQRLGEEAVAESVNNYLSETCNLPDLVGYLGDSIDRFRTGQRKDMTSLLMFRYFG